jgi:hypothetical protein
MQVIISKFGQINSCWAREDCWLQTSNYTPFSTKELVIFGKTTMKLKNLLLLVVLLAPYFSIAQQQQQCGVSKQAGDLIKQRLMSNRQLFTKQQVIDLVTNRTITYIPISFHSVSNSGGEGAATEGQIFDFLCGLNGIYLDQDIQFFIYNQINFRTSNAIDDDASTNASSSAMSGWKINGTLNITIGRSLSNPSSSWYSPWADYIFLLKQMMTPQAKTEAHEIGHFFTLPHPFYGWEGTAVSTYNGQCVPSSIGSGWSQFNPEAVARTGPNANCNSAGDGFCGTPADYTSERTACPYNISALDPNCHALTPDDSNMMCYASNSCRTTFSTDQKAAVAMDVATRNWASNSPGSTADLVAQPVVTPISPANNASLGSISNPTVRVEWTPTTGATAYYVEVYGAMLPPFNVINYSDVIYRSILWTGATHLDLSTTNMVAGKRYFWRVKAISNYSTCAAYSPYYEFDATASVTTSIKELPIKQQITFKVNSNPITTTDIPLTIYTAEEIVGSIRIYSMDGREVISANKQQLAQGESVVQLPGDNIANGIYIAVLFTDRGQLQQKIIIQK